MVACEKGHMQGHDRSGLLRERTYAICKDAMDIYMRGHEGGGRLRESDTCEDILKSRHENYIEYSDKADNCDSLPF